MSDASSWFKALEGQELEVRSARDVLQVQGWLDTGNYALNWAISGRLLRGYPLGHSVEISGDPATGKSFLATRALGMVQQEGGVALLDDVEGAYNLDWIGALGVDADAMPLKRSRTVREHLELIQKFLAAYRDLGTDRPAVYVVDSHAALSTEHELEVGLEKRDMTKAAELKSLYRQIQGELIKVPVVYIATTHTIANIGNPWNPRTTTGGGGPKYHSSVRLDLRTPSKIKSGADHVGVISTVVVQKNRFTAPWKKVRLAIPFYRPVSRASGLIPLLLDLGVLDTNGHYLTLEGEKTGIHAYKSKKRFIDQDRSAEELLDKYPMLLDEVDELLAAREAEGGPPWQGATLGDLREDADEDEE